MIFFCCRGHFQIQIFLFKYYLSMFLSPCNIVLIIIINWVARKMRCLQNICMNVVIYFDGTFWLSPQFRISVLRIINQYEKLNSGLFAGVITWAMGQVLRQYCNFLLQQRIKQTHEISYTNPQLLRTNIYKIYSTLIIETTCLSTILCAVQMGVTIF